MTRAAITDALRLIFQGSSSSKRLFPIARLQSTVDWSEISVRSLPRLNTTSCCTRLLSPPMTQTRQMAVMFKSRRPSKSRSPSEGVPDYYLGFKLHEDGRHEEVFNGPGRLIYERYAIRKGIGESLLSFPISELRKLSAKVPEHERIPRRSQVTDAHDRAQG